jgi:hypothetical protein
MTSQVAISIAMLSLLFAIVSFAMSSSSNSEYYPQRPDAHHEVIPELYVLPPAEDQPSAKELEVFDPMPLPRLPEHDSSWEEQL